MCGSRPLLLSRGDPALTTAALAPPPSPAPTRPGFLSGVHLWLVRVQALSEPDSIFIGVCRGVMPLDADPQDLRDRTYYLSNGVIRVGGRRVATNAAQFTKGDVVGVVLDADQARGAARCAAA